MQGRELLDTLHAFAPGSGAAAMLRHAERFRILDPREPTLAEITPAGAATAEDFGRRVRGFDRVRIFHSAVKRCRQTAECIARGVAANGLAAEVAGPQAELGVGYISDQLEIARLSELHGEYFVRLWFAGQLPPSLIRPAAVLAAEQLALLHARLLEPSPGERRLDLHVSHDWNVLVLREHLLQVRHEDTGWLTYLDGVAFQAGPDGLRAVYREQSRQRPLPWEFAPAS